MSMPHHCKGQDGAINCESYAGAFGRRVNFYQALQVDTSLVASSIIADQ
jgi:hypothetical protein